MSIEISNPHPGVRQLTIDRPEKRNALDTASYAALAAGISAADADEDVRVILVTGARGAFTSGNDLADFRGQSDTGPVIAFLRALVLVDTPLVAAVEGPAIGIGSTVLLHCDLVVAAESTTFALPFVPLGLAPEAGSSYLLPRTAGTKLATELLLLGESFSAEVALRAGLINRVVPTGEALDAALALAVRLGGLPAEAVRATRRLLHTDRKHLLAVIDEEARVFAERLASAETQAILASFGRRTTQH